jgi:hypothetical protein
MWIDGGARGILPPAWAPAAYIADNRRASGDKIPILADYAGPTKTAEIARIKRSRRARWEESKNVEVRGTRYAR